MIAAAAAIEVLRPRHLKDALMMMRVAADEGHPLVPMAGGTDLFVTLNAGSKPAASLPRSVAARQAARHREPRQARVVVWRARDLHRLHRVEGRAQAAADPRRCVATGGRRADPEPRHARGQHRERLARGRRRAGADGRRRHRRAALARRGAHGAARRVLHRLPQDGAPAGRAHRPHRRRRPRRARSASTRWERARRRRSPRS